MPNTGWVAWGGVHLQAGHVAGQVAKVARAEVLDILGRDDRHGDRHFLHRLRARLRGDDHLLDFFVGGVRGKRCACRGAGEGQGDAARKGAPVLVLRRQWRCCGCSLHGCLHDISRFDVDVFVLPCDRM
jgi:hypothetical protein